MTTVYFHAIFQTLSYFTRIMKRVNKQVDELKRFKNKTICTFIHVINLFKHRNHLYVAKRFFSFFLFDSFSCFVFLFFFRKINSKEGGVTPIWMDRAPMTSNHQAISECKIIISRKKPSTYFLILGLISAGLSKSQSETKATQNYSN